MLRCSGRSTCLLRVAQQLGEYGRKYNGHWVSNKDACSGSLHLLAASMPGAWSLYAADRNLYCAQLASSPCTTVAVYLTARCFPQAWDACLERPWQDNSTTSAGTLSVSLTTFEELQQYIDKANGPTTFIVHPSNSSLVAKRPVQISKADITISSSSDVLTSGPSDALQLSVDCAAAGSLLQIRQVVLLCSCANGRSCLDGLLQTLAASTKVGVRAHDR